jgi:type IV pilus assembly protein PilO
MNSVFIKVASLTYQKTMIFGVVLAVLYYFFMFDDGSAIDKNIEAAQQQVRAEESKLVDSDKAIKKLAGIKAHVAALEEQYKTLSAQVPTEVNMADIIKQIDMVASTSGVSVRDKVPKPSQKKETLEEFPLAITATGSFSDLTLFLYHLMNTERLNKIISVSLNKVSQGRGSQGKTLAMDVVVANYRYIVEPKALAPAGGGKK